MSTGQIAAQNDATESRKEGNSEKIGDRTWATSQAPDTAQELASCHHRTDWTEPIKNTAYHTLFITRPSNCSWVGEEEVNEWLNEIIQVNF